MTPGSEGVRIVDLQFQGAPHVIATAVLDTGAGLALVDPGPTSCLPALRAGLDALGARLPDVAAVLLTHIHLDHAGVTGHLARELPDLEVFVHERGAKHMIDPARLLDSAKRLYGDQMDRLWGEFLAVPAGNVRALVGGERISVGQRSLDVAYTPGHASHHVSYLDASGGLAFVGDTCGVRLASSPFVMAPTPPPDIDLAAWDQSLRRILAWSPQALFLTHFGPTPTPPAEHVEALREALAFSARTVRDALVQHPDPADDGLAAAVFADATRRRMRERLSDAEVHAYELGAPLDHCYLGLARFWRKHSAQ